MTKQKICDIIIKIYADIGKTIFEKGTERQTMNVEKPMNTEKSCGAIVYRKFHGNTEILLIRHIKSGYWSFPKGHVEKTDKSEEETARREIKEETNIDVLIDTGFRETVSFSPRRDTIKTVVYFVAKALNNDTKPQEEEISEIRWVEIGQAKSYLTYDNDKDIVSKAKAFIALMK